ncbi:protein kinase STUNTED-like isoform X2 [Gastrolobium bilobum]|uniref:protein kinase STUNTED-like isoform X2 n=1 Tax=Gastrolobium bilobum TaxID=150636 RepID=UPI002AB04973|nr:protein kinase STUNTED-like isoform X2 [Gastrolobium bilobum]
MPNNNTQCSQKERIETPAMKLTGDGGGGRKFLVGVKLDSRSRELLTWALVKVAEPGDLVIALHVIDTITDAEDTGSASVLSVVKTFDSVLAVYEGFCNLKQVDLKLKVCRGASARKLVVKEAKSLGVATVILETSKSYHPIRSSLYVAKYCARKLPKCISVLAVHNGKVAFHREATGMCTLQGKLNESPALLNKYLAVKMKKNLKNCECCTRVLALPEDSATKLKPGLTDDGFEEENSLALVPIQKLDDDDDPSYSIAVDKSNQSTAGWSLLRQVFLPNKHMRKSLGKNSPALQTALRQTSYHSSAVVHPDHKQNIHRNYDSTLDGESGIILPFGSDDIFPPPSLGRDLSELPKELLGLQQKYSSLSRLYSFQELVSATANFSHGGCSEVYRGCLPDGKELAVKILKSSEVVIKEFVQEIEIITTLHHKNIISLLGFCVEGHNLLLVYDLLSRGSLEENLYGIRNDSGAFGWQERYKVAVGVAEALNYLHNCCTPAVIHRDVKSSNILLSDDFEPQLSDFGLASWSSSSSHSSCTDVAGTFGYLAPEYFMHGRVTEKIDVYAFGVVLLELLSSKKPINNDCPKGQKSLVMWAIPILKGGKLSQLLDPSLGSDYNHCHIERMILAASLCIRRASRLRPQICIILKLLRGDEEVRSWAEQEVGASQELDGFDEEPVPSNIQSHLNLALLDLEDDTDSISSTEQNVSLVDYLSGRWSRSSSFD